MNQSNKKKKIIITGVSSGIGYSIVSLLSNRNDVELIGLGRNDIDSQPSNYKFIEVDLSNSNSITKVINLLKDEQIDIFINNAGVGFRGTIEDLSIENIRKQFEINYFGPTELLKSLIPKLRSNQGIVINLAALGSLLDIPTFGYYEISKLAFSKTLDILNEESEIKVANIYLGAVKSSFGKNIIETINIENSIYKSLYEEWQIRFRNFFSDRNKAEDVAKLVESIIFESNGSQFVSYRDKVLAFCKCHLPKRLFNIVLKYFYKL